MSVEYHCPHLLPPHPPLPPSYPSSAGSFSPLTQLYFCEECDAVRCDGCVATEVASYFCPNCLFDVPGANVRADKNRCARSCFSCPQCSTSLQVQADPRDDGEGISSAVSTSGPYVLACPCCRWSSREVGWLFDKPTGLAQQLAKVYSATESVQSEFDALKDHLESYLSSSNPVPAQPARGGRNPTRHISQLTQMAARALHREIPGMAAASARARGVGVKSGVKGESERMGWDELGEYRAKAKWKDVELENSLEVEEMREFEVAGAGGVAELEQRWDKSWVASRTSRSMLPTRIPLQTKLTKRCPHPTCRHLLIQVDTKSVRMKIKMVAANYLPAVEISRRRRRMMPGGEGGTAMTSMMALVEVERRRERRKTRAVAREEDEDMETPLLAGEVYTFQLAFTNPLYDPIQIRLTQPHFKSASPSTQQVLVHIPTPHFTINALKDAWAYDEEEEDYDGEFEGTEATSEDGPGSLTGTGTGSGGGTLGRKARLNVLAGGGERDKVREKKDGFERKGNVSKVGLELEVLPEAKGDVQFDIEVRYTYRADEGAGGAEGEESKGGGDGELYKTFTFWVRVHAGVVEEM